MCENRVLNNIIFLAFFFPFPTLYYFYEKNISPCGPVGPLPPPHEFFLENLSVFSVFWGTSSPVSCFVVVRF